MSKSYEIDMCHGPLAGKILRFSLPLMLSSMLQLIFNAADVIVVGRFSGSEALAAVGSTGPLINLMINLFIGLSVGANVVVARALGANHPTDVSKAVHTSLLLSAAGGILLAVIGIPLAKPALELMGSPDNVIDLSTLYLRIYFIGIPATLIYNFGSSILRAAGDTKRPLYYLVTAGIINVILNLFFVIFCKMSVDGVATATVISQVVSAVLIVKCLLKDETALRLIPKQLKIHKQKLLQIVRIGLPAGIQGMVFSLSNIVLQSAINSFGSDTMAGSAAAANVEGFVYVAMNSLYQASLTFTGQNIGAGQYGRIKRIYVTCALFSASIGIILSSLVLLFRYQLLGIYSSSPQVIAEGITRFKFVCVPYFLCGLMDVTVGSLRGIGYSILPMIVSLIGACGLRLLWVATIFRMHPSTNVLFMSYPITWFVTFAAHLICFSLALRKLPYNN